MLGGERVLSTVHYSMYFDVPVLVQQDKVLVRKIILSIFDAMMNSLHLLYYCICLKRTEQREFSLVI